MKKRSGDLDELIIQQPQASQTNRSRESNPSNKVECLSDREGEVVVNKNQKNKLETMKNLTNEHPGIDSPDYNLYNW